MQKKISISATVEQTQLSVSVTGAPAGAGVAVGHTLPSSNVTITNTSLSCDVQYQTGAGPWLQLKKTQGVDVAVNLAITSLNLRRASLDGGPCTVDLVIEDVTGLVGPIGQTIFLPTAFTKAVTTAVAFIKTAAATANLKAGTYVNVAGTLLTFAVDTAITMPALTAGTDYAIYVCTDGTVRADASFSAPTGYTTANSRKIGGFHYSPGGHSGVSGGGDATPQINEYSFWDLRFKPACTDPRGMALVADGFWSDIYLLGVDHLTNGTSKYNVTIADGSSPPKVPTKFGGNGTTAYTSLSWWVAAEVMQSHGKRLPSYAEFAALAYGTTEAASIGADPVSTTWAAAYISKWGCAQSSGNLWIWAANFGGGAAAAGWSANTDGRGSTYQMENALLVGGNWGVGSICGSRCSHWGLSATYSDGVIGSRGACDHLTLE